MFSKSMQWVNVLLNIDIANGYACNFVHVVSLLFHWWNMFFPFNLIDFGPIGDTFGWGTSLMLGAFIFFIICISCPLLLCKFSSNSFTQLKQRSNHMLALVMLNPMKNRAIWYGIKVPSTTLWIKFVVTYIVNSSSMSTYKICKTSMSNLTCHIMATIK